MFVFLEKYYVSLANKVCYMCIPLACMHLTRVQKGKNSELLIEHYSLEFNLTFLILLYVTTCSPKFKRLFFAHCTLLPLECLFNLVILFKFR